MRACTTNQMSFGFAAIGDEPTAFWQARFYDYNVYSTEKIKEKLNYMHANPVIRRLVEHPKIGLGAVGDFTGRMKRD